ncbi:MAG: hypothetical protein A2583_09775 [Bdellovibrionales bacterium RIFOXYD1_FULL_53_11]|nr:MAG: hypothetical protein A2583_09775 [Bdellovibrionales bacterium RIFOXYD1_FULL_53_11]
MRKTVETLPLAVIAALTFAAAAVLQIVFFRYGWKLPVAGWRDGQTAMGIEYIIKGGPLLAYHVPIFGPPWAWPIEFPFYQWIAALLAKLSGMTVDQSAKLTAYIFYVLACVPAWGILRRLGVRCAVVVVFLSIYLSSPLYVALSRTALIESCALFLGLCYLEGVMRYRMTSGKYGKLAALVLCSLWGALAAMTKITTFAGFFLAAFILLWMLPGKSAQRHNAIPVIALIRRLAIAVGTLLLVLAAWKILSGKITTGPILVKTIGVLFFAAIAAAVFMFFRYARGPAKENILVFLRINIAAIIALAAWQVFTKHSWLKTPMLDFHSDTYETFRWYIGFVGQRFDPEIISRIMIERPSGFLLGSKYTLFAIYAGWIFADRYRLHALVSLGLFVAVSALFTNLHNVHPYYAYANGLFLFAAAAFIVAGLWERGLAGKIPAAAFVAAVVFYCVQGSVAMGRAIVRTHDHEVVAFSKKIEAVTDPESVLVIFGLYANPSIPYLSHRRAVMDNRDRPFEQKNLQAALRDVRAEGRDVGALLICNKQLENGIENSKRIRGLGMRSKPSIIEAGCDVYLPRLNTKKGS